ncbi:MAG: YkgJ family cysteine cluster protein [Planctomycetota bacterium]
MTIDQCSQCDGKCCKYFCLEIDEPDTYEEFEDVRWYLCHGDVSVHIDEDGDWYLSVMNACRFLDDANRCTIYEDRPLICRTYSQDGCDFTQGDYQYQQLFHTPEELDAYAEKTLGKLAYRSAKKKARRKLEKKAEKEARKREKKRAKDRKKAQAEGIAKKGDKSGTKKAKGGKGKSKHKRKKK